MTAIPRPRHLIPRRADLGLVPTARMSVARADPTRASRPLTSRAPRPLVLPNQLWQHPLTIPISDAAPAAAVPVLSSTDSRKVCF